ncbi:hypothetical protein ARMGADRAFT_1074865 [Armillaria gallica]|uniref:Uncharacterized protein n=1 Tax=Armillaria gallica TaxID=47427 RepID=A0A2H3EA56_ARMGA|nr:hypothetical protein ARMGADRAFT_1074865 [Armillaria gallica]
MEFHVSDAVPYIAETLVIWDYLISIDDEVALLWAFLKTIVDQIFVLSESLPRDISPNLGYVPYVISELAAFQLLHSFLPKFFDTT